LGRSFLLPGRNRPSLIDTAGAEQVEAQEVRWGEVTVEEPPEAGTTASEAGTPAELGTTVGMGKTAEAGTIAEVGTAAGEE
jgi:hypothetical protein